MLKKIRQVFSVTHCGCSNKYIEDEEKRKPCKSCEDDRMRVKEIEELVEKDKDNIWFKQEETTLEYVGSETNDFNDDRTEYVKTTRFFKILKED